MRNVTQDYFRRKLGIILRDLSSYDPQEMARALVRLAKTADEAEAIKEAAPTIAPDTGELEKLREALTGALAVIEDYLDYEHNGDPWTEDARAMGEMDINDYKHDGRLDAARAALAPIAQQKEQGNG